VDVQSLQRWHWIAIGTIVGLAVGWAQHSGRQSERMGGEGFISQAAFERELRLPPVDGRPRMKSLTVYTVGELDIVQMRRLMLVSEGWAYLPARFAAPRPYRPVSASAFAAPFPSVQDYIADLARTNPHVQFRHGWWREPMATVALWTAGGMILVGGLWPTLIGLLTGAGFGRKTGQEPEYDLGRFQSEPEQPALSGPTAEDEARLRELEQAMLKNLQEQTASGSTFDAQPAVSSPPAMKALNVSLDQVQLSPPLEQPKHYEGEYYPVAREASKDAEGQPPLPIQEP